MPLFFLGYAYMTWWCVAISLIIAAFSERSIWFEKIWPVLSYMYLPVSGFFYMAAWMVRDAPRLRRDAPHHEVSPSMASARMQRNFFPTCTLCYGYQPVGRKVVSARLNALWRAPADWRICGRNNMPLLYHRNVTPFDVVAARMIVEIAGNYGAVVFSFLVPLFGLLGMRDVRRHLVNE